jgi:hypothetical protein
MSSSAANDPSHFLPSTSHHDLGTAMADFDSAGQAFLAWLQQSGAEISPKVKLEDLRHAQAGRGVGELLLI